MTVQTAPQRLAIIAALPREIQGLVRSLDRSVRPREELRREGIWVYRLPQIVIVAAGMGTARVTLAVQEALQAQPGTTELVSVGLAGGCDASLNPGAVVEPDVAIDIKTGERYGVPSSGPLLATTAVIAGVVEKQRLAKAYGAALVDMEAATVGRLAAAHGLRFSMVKAISDGPDFEIAALGRFADRRGHFRTAAFALHTALRPHQWAQAAELGRNSNRALEAMTARLLDRITEAS